MNNGALGARRGTELRTRTVRYGAQEGRGGGGGWTGTGGIGTAKRRGAGERRVKLVQG